ncbi:MAG: hypothetical protein KBT40_07400 [bacterium]|nr:hypothetical protein [Candidatus Minthenecus merdequi]
MATFPSYDDEPHKRSICRGVGTPLDKYTRSSLFDLLVFLLRTSAIQANLIALGLSSVHLL